MCRIFIATGVELADLYIYLSVTLFMSLTSLGSMSIQTITAEVQSPIPKIQNEINYRIKKWKHRFGLIHDFIEEIDKFFGPILFIFFARMFIILVVVLFKLNFYISIMTSSSIIDASLHLVKILLYVSLVAFRSQKMEQQVSLPWMSTDKRIRLPCVFHPTGFGIDQRAGQVSHLRQRYSIGGKFWTKQKHKHDIFNSIDSCACYFRYGSTI